MSADDSTIDRFIGQIKGEARSSPAGIDWQRFYEFLQKKRKPGRNRPPMPLILAASAESDASKLERLSSQLRWALENDCLSEAIAYLEAIPSDNWNTGSLDRWEEDSYPRQ